MLNVQGIEFGPVIQLPEKYEVYDFTEGYDPDRYSSSAYGFGRYDERRPNMYAGEQYEEPKRDIHVGLDIAALVLVFSMMVESPFRVTMLKPMIMA